MRFSPLPNLEPGLFQEREEPHVDCYECEVDVSPSRTGAFSLTSGDLGDLSSFSSKASGPQHTSSGGSSALSANRSRANSAGQRRGSQDLALPAVRKPRWVGALEIAGTFAQKLVVPFLGVRRSADVLEEE